MASVRWIWIAPLAVAAGIAGCGNFVTSQDDDGPAPDDGWCQEDPHCRAPDQQVDSCPPNSACYWVHGCMGADALCESYSCPGDPGCPIDAKMVSFCGDSPGCYSLINACNQTIWCQGPCTAAACNQGDFAVYTCPPGATCYQVMGCNSALTCAVASTCTVQCDPGDTAADICPPDAPCYFAEYCGGSKNCIDSALPEHGCPETAPDAGTPCGNVLGQSCTYPTMPGCEQMFVCDGDWLWLDAGETCAQP